MAKKKQNWIQAAIKNPGALRAQAEKEGAITKKGTISKSWLREKAKGSGVTAKRARLALTLAEMRAKKKR